MGIFKKKEKERYFKILGINPNYLNKDDLKSKEELYFALKEHCKEKVFSNLDIKLISKKTNTKEDFFIWNELQLEGDERIVKNLFTVGWENCLIPIGIINSKKENVQIAFKEFCKIGYTTSGTYKEIFRFIFDKYGIHIMKDFINIEGRLSCKDREIFLYFNYDKKIFLE